VVLARTDGPGEPKLVAYFVKRAGVSATAAELRDFLTHRLPAHMVPYAYVELDAVPLTMNGKIDRQMLPRPSDATQGAPEAVTTPLEIQIMEIWSDTLGTRRVGVGDNFFDLGGDSLLLAGVHVRLKRDLSIDVPITDLFEFPTVRSLASHLSRNSAASSSFEDARQRAHKQRAAFARKYEGVRGRRERS
jgi:acyl carrier protein